MREKLARSTLSSVIKLWGCSLERKFREAINAGVTLLIRFVLEHRESIISRGRLVRMTFLEVIIAHQVSISALEFAGFPLILVLETHACLPSLPRSNE